MSPLSLTRIKPLSTFCLFAGELIIVSIKYRTTKLIKTLDSELEGDTPLLQLPSYMLTQSKSAVQAHSYVFNKVTLRSMLGAMTMNTSADTIVS